MRNIEGGSTTTAKIAAWHPAGKPVTLREPSAAGAAAPGHTRAASIGMRPYQPLNDAPLGAGFAVAAAFAGVGIALIALSSGSGRASGLVLLISGVIICAGTLLEGAKRAENRKWLRLRKSFWIEKADGSRREISYGYVLDLPAEARRQLLASDKQLQAWFQGEWSTEALALTVETVAANPLKRVWLWFVQPRRFREP